MRFPQVPLVRQLFAVLTLTATAALVAAIAAPGASAKAKGFKYGVAAGDVSSESAILWARAAKPGKTGVAFVRAGRGRLGGCDLSKEAKQDGLVLKAKKKDDLTVQLEVDDLKPGKDYLYRFCQKGGKKSETGKFTTAPKEKQAKTIRFALSGDQDARPAPGGTEPYWNNFEVWKRIKAQDNDFNVLMGDTIYSDTEVPGYTIDDVAISVKEKWAAYKTNLAMKPWSKARGSAAYYAHWDDHEFINDFSREENSFPYRGGSVDIDGETLYEDGVKAFTDYNPITYSDKNGIYRSERWGRNLEIFFLDERSFRSASADFGGACDNPAGSGNPDLAPTAPQSTRNVFAAIAPPLANPVPPECLAKINDPSRTMLGSRQLNRFKQAIADSDARFKVIFNEVPIQQYYALPYDRWEGYEAERQEILHYLQDNVKNVVFLTTDVHANLVNDARFNTLGGPGVQNSGILDITTGPVATANYSLEISDAVGNPAAGALVQSAFLKPQPPNGVGMQCAATDQFSYAQVAVSKSRLTVDLLDINDQPVLDTGDSETPGAPPCAQVVIPAE